MSEQPMRLVDWLDDLCVRFIINLPQEELESVERICFQIEEAQWFYEDFIRPLDPALPSMNLKKFCLLIFQHCPLLSNFTEQHRAQAYQEFLAYKTRVPVRGAIMLNEEMDQAVLVKGWKKGAKWSFPRGKINKEEKDLDCAIREVYEETGFDVRAAGLAKREEDLKYIQVSMREQDMGLYVFRGVPMDTYFEPRTRKEISKISWYRLSDLPTSKRSKQQNQQGYGEDLLRDNMFYMVAPFLGPLRHWIKQQRKADRLRMENGAREDAAAALEVDETDTAQVGELTADEAPREPVPDPSFEQLIANLGRPRPSDALPEVNMESQAPADPAAALKRLLMVPTQPAPEPVEAPAVVPKPNPLLDLLRGNGGPSSKPAPPPPHTPFDHMVSPPEAPRSPHHHHPRPPHLAAMAPPPPFGFQRPPQQMQFPENRYPPYPPSAFSSEFQRQPSHQFPPRATPQGPIRAPFFPHPAQNIQEAFDQGAHRPYQRTGDSFAQPSPGPMNASAVPAASKLPPPKLNAHTLGLLHTLKSGSKANPTRQANPPPPVQQPPHLIQRGHLVQPPAAVAEEVAAPSSSGSAFPTASHPVAPKPRNNHQNALLGLFRSPQATVAEPQPPIKPSLAPEPVELAAPPTPNLPKQSPTVQGKGFPLPALATKGPLLDAFTGKPGLTSATVSGPLNVPDFDAAKKQVKGVAAHGHEHRASPVQHDEKGKQPFAPMQILTNPNRGRSQSPAVPTVPTKTKTPVPASPKARMPESPKQPFRPQILKRPPQPPTAMNGPAPTSAPVKGPVPLQSSKTSVSPKPVASKQKQDPLAGTNWANFGEKIAARDAENNARALEEFERKGGASYRAQIVSATYIDPKTKKKKVVDVDGNGAVQPSSAVDLAPPVKATQAVAPAPGPQEPAPVQQQMPYIPVDRRESVPAGQKNALLSLFSKQTPAKSPPPAPKPVVPGVMSPVSPLPTNTSQGSPADLTSRSRISSIGEGPIPPILPSATSAIFTQAPAPAVLEEGYTSAGSAGRMERAGSTTGRTPVTPVDKKFLLGFLENVARGAK